MHWPSVMYFTSTDDDPIIGLPLAFGLLLSALVHIALFMLFLSRPQVTPAQPFVANVSIELPPPDVLNVPRIPAAPKPPGEDVKEPSRPAPPLNQIVSSPDNATQSKPDMSKRVFQADRDASTDRERVKRGDGKDAGAPGAMNEASHEQRAAPKAADEKPAAPRKGDPAHASQKSYVEKAPKAMKETSPPADANTFSTSHKPLEHLKLDDSDVLERFAMNSKPDPSLKEKLSGQENLGDYAAYQPFSRPAGSGARFLGKSGVTDYLPNLPDGDITLLNTKANKFATFVSRVATQVFAQMRARGLEGLSGPEIMKADDANVVRVRLSRKGELLDISLEKGSGSARFDEVLTSSARLGAKDPNPPGDAVAADGTIHFIFQSQIWGQIGTDPRTGQIGKRIWLLLATGLE